MESFCHQKIKFDALMKGLDRIKKIDLIIISALENNELSSTGFNS
jgi:hypothetical protein